MFLEMAVFTFPNGSVHTGAVFFPLPAGPVAGVLESAHVFPHPMNFSAVNDTIGCGRRRSTFCS